MYPGARPARSSRSTTLKPMSSAISSVPKDSSAVACFLAVWIHAWTASHDCTIRRGDHSHESASCASCAQHAQAGSLFRFPRACASATIAPLPLTTPSHALLALRQAGVDCWRNTATWTVPKFIEDLCPLIILRSAF